MGAVWSCLERDQSDGRRSIEGEYAHVHQEPLLLDPSSSSSLSPMDSLTATTVSATRSPIVQTNTEFDLNHSSSSSGGLIIVMGFEHAHTATAAQQQIQFNNNNNKSSWRAIHEGFGGDVRMGMEDDEESDGDHDDDTIYGSVDELLVRGNDHSGSSPKKMWTRGVKKPSKEVVTHEDVDVEFLTHLHLYTHYGMPIDIVDSPATSSMNSFLLNKLKKSGIASGMTEGRGTVNKNIESGGPRSIGSEYGIDYDQKRRAIFNNALESVELPPRDEFLDLSMQYYEKFELNLSTLREQHVDCVMLFASFPKAETQLKEISHFAKRQLPSELVNSTGKSVVTQRVVQKKSPASRRFVTRIFDRHTRQELCRYATDISSFETVQERGLLCGLLRVKKDHGHWCFRGSNDFRIRRPVEFVVHVHEAMDLPAKDTNGSSAYVVANFDNTNPEKRLFKTKTISKSTNPKWDERFTFKTNTITDSLRPNVRLCMSVFDSGSHTLMDTISLPMCDIFDPAQSHFLHETERGKRVLKLSRDGWFDMSMGRLHLTFMFVWT